MNPWALLGVLLLGLATTAGAYLRGRHDEREAVDAQAGRDARTAAVAADAAASAIAAGMSRITVRHQTVRQEVEREIQTRDVYRDPDCRTGADSLRLFNSAIPGYVESGASGVPATGAGD